MRRLKSEFLDSLGWVLCELAFKTGCRGPIAFAYRAGCWCYGRADDFNISAKQ